MKPLSQFIAEQRAKPPLKRAADFTANEREVIRERRRYQPASDLAAVFDTSPQVIGAICRGVS